MELNDNQIERYARHIILKEIGGLGQAALLNARVLVVGAGGLGSPVLMYLAAAGVGTLGVIDFDEVSLSNLQRQIIHSTDDVGSKKTESAAATIASLNPDVRVVKHDEKLSADNAMAIIAEYDLVADGSDTFSTRFLVNDACYLGGKTLVSAAVGRFDGQLATYKAHAGDFPCYRCIFPAPPPDGTVPSCAEAGVMGALTGVMGTLQVTEIIKEIVQTGQSMAGRLLIYDGLDTSFRTVKVKPDPECQLCGPQSTLNDLSHHQSGAAV